MAQEQRREQPVRLPNPSAQPFVAALKTTRFFAVLFFWVTMVCVLAHAATFCLVEWVGAYDLPAAESKPVEIKPVDETVRGPAPWLGVFENAAAAAVPGELFPNVKPEPSSRQPAPSKPATAGALEEESPPDQVESPSPETEGRVVAEPEEPVRKPAPLTPEQRRLRARYYRNLTSCVLRPARIIGTLSGVLLAVTLFLYLEISLLGRLAGIRRLTRSLFVLLLFLWTVLPWDCVFEGFRTSAMFDFEALLAAHTARAGAAAGDWLGAAMYFGQFLVMPAVSVILLAWSGIQFAGGYGESVLANE